MQLCAGCGKEFQRNELDYIKDIIQCDGCRGRLFCLECRDIECPYCKEDKNRTTMNTLIKKVKMMVEIHLLKMLKL